MPNEVEITITAHDLTGPAFAAAMAKMKALKAAAGDVRHEMAGMGVPSLDIGRMTASLTALRSKIQALGIADIADVNVPMGRLTMQMNVLKRLINQAGIADIMDIGVNTDQVNRAIASMKSESFSIPVSWDIHKLILPHMPVGIVEPVVRLGHMPSGPTSPASFQQRIMPIMGPGPEPFSVMTAGLNRYNSAFAAGIPLWKAGAGWFGFLRGKVQLFGGALTAIGVPGILAAASGLHILIDGAIEFLAVGIPALVALAAFSAAAVPTVMDLSKAMKSVFTTSTAFGHNIYPMTGAFTKMADAVQPKVYQLFGSALVVMGRDSGAFTKLAVGAGDAIDHLAARAGVAMTSGGFGKFLSSGPADLAMFGSVIGNIFGIIGNMLRVMPGYAQMLLGTLDSVTRGIENITGSGLGQWLVGAGLWFHGFILWGGLAATAAVYLGNGLVALGAKFGLAEAGALSFDAVQFGTGISVMAHGIADASIALVTFSGAEDLAAASATIFDGALIALGAVNPLVWVGLAAAALGGFVFLLTRATSATKSFDDATNKSLASSPIGQLQIGIAKAYSNTIFHLADAQNKLSATSSNAASVQRAYTQNLGRGNQQTIEISKTIQGYQGELTTLRGYQSNYNTLVKAAGGNLSLFNQAGITTNDILNASGQTLKQYIFELQAAVDTQKALNLGTGRYAAAQNAQRNTFMTETLPALQTVTQAEDNLLNVVLAGPQAFVAFQQSIGTMGTAAKATTLGIGGLSKNALALASAFYTSAVPAAQKMVDALQQQDISQGKLTKVIATQASELLTYAGKNVEARAVIISLINNALGPGTVSLKDLNKWVKTNSTSLQGMNSIVAQSSIKAGSLASVLQNNLNNQLHQFLLKTTGADTMLRTYTQDLLDNKSKTIQGENARKQLITDLENSGLTARQAKAYVDNLQRSISAMKGKTVGVGVVASGSGKLTFAEQALGQNAQGFLEFHSAGGISGSQGVRRLPGYGGGDKILSMLEAGETVIDKDTSRNNAWLLRMMGVPGYGKGGVVGNPQSLVNWTSGNEVSFMKRDEQQWAEHALAAAKAQLADALARQSRASFGRGIPGGPGGGAPAANAALAHHLFASNLTPTSWAAWNYVAMRESGWNQFATNPSSGAYGIPQALPPTKMPFVAQRAGGSNPQAQIIWMWDYMGSSYGGPIGAANHERAFNWYGNGLDAVVNRPTLIGVGERGSEHVSVTPVGRGNTTTLEIVPGGQGIFEQFMATFMRKFIRQKGGGDVQQAFLGYRG